LRSLKSYSAAQNWRSGSRLLWQPTHSLPATEWLLSRPMLLSGVMLFALENDWPSATSSVWFAVTRCWLLSLVFHSARYAGVVKKLTRGSARLISFAVRRFGRSYGWM